MAKRSLLTGVAYHGNRMLSHAIEDMKTIARADMDVVLHMYSHTDWTRHKAVMKDMFKATEDQGLEVWVDNWGLSGPPGDTSHFLAFYPDSHTYFNNGEMSPTYACLNSPDLRDFQKKWIDDVYEIGGRTIFWDEPCIPKKKLESGEFVYGCCCPRCKKLFEERYNRPMPTENVENDKDFMQFRTDTVVDYFRELTEYSTSLGMKNICCVMVIPEAGSDFELLDRICSLPTMYNVGSDPYWFVEKDAHPYEFVYNQTKDSLALADKHGKDHNIWIQTFRVPAGREEEIIQATEAAYDAGARTILAWGFNGSESNTYRAENPIKTWEMTVEAMRRIRSIERDKILAENRKKYMK